MINTILLKPTIIILDDNKELLEEIKYHLEDDDNKYDILLYSSPAEALDFIKNHTINLDSFDKNWNKLSNNEEFEEHYFAFLKEISKETSYKKMAPLLIVDYHLEDTKTGLDICTNSPKSMRKILLTGKFAASDAIDFKGEIFDDYIEKGYDIKIFAKLKEKVQKNIEAYFTKLSSPLFEYIKENEIESLIFNAEYHDFLYEKMQELCTNQYYFADISGSCVLTGEGKKYFIYVQNEDYMKSTIYEYDDLDSKKIKKEIEEFKVIPAIIKEDNNVIFPEIDELEKNLYPVQKRITTEKTNFYICII